MKITLCFWILFIFFTKTRCHVYYATSTPSSGESFTMSKSSVYELCSCDLIQGICDPLCCCDDDCSSDVSLWENDFGYTCKNSVDAATVFCYDKVHIYKINEKRGLKKTTSSNSELQCVQGSGNFIDSSYTAVQTLTTAEQTALRENIPYNATNFT